MKLKNKARSAIPGIISVLLIILLAACATYSQYPKLLPDEEEFLSKVRYIITKEERKRFLELPSPEREKFIEEFWKKRDPDPTTEENEYKIMYLDRVEEANRRFSGEGRPGWLTDRGRIFILFGPPTNIERFKGDYIGMNFDVYRDTIVWYYYYIPIVFVDTRGNGEFELSYTSLQQLSSLNNYMLKLQEIDRQKAFPEGFSFDFELSAKKDNSGLHFIEINVPYKNIWFVEKKDKLEVTLFLTLEIMNSRKEKVIDYNKEFLISLSEEELLKLKNELYKIKIPLILEKGTYKARTNISTSTFKEGISNTLVFAVTENQ